MEGSPPASFKKEAVSRGGLSVARGNNSRILTKKTKSEKGKGISRFLGPTQGGKKRRHFGRTRCPAFQGTKKKGEDDRVKRRSSINSR